jgi:hypothetical protein
MNLKFSNASDLMFSVQQSGTEIQDEGLARITGLSFSMKSGGSSITYGIVILLVQPVSFGDPNK